MKPTLLVLALAPWGCTPTDRGFGGGGDPLPEDTALHGSDDTAAPLLDDDVLLDCADRGDVDASSGASPPSLVGRWSVEGQVVANDLGVEEGTATSGSLCLSSQDDDGGIEVEESAALTESRATWAAIRGTGDAFTLWMEIESDDPLDGDCVLRALSIISGTRNEDLLDFRSATVVVELEDCESLDPEQVGACWATAATATLAGACE